MSHVEIVILYGITVNPYHVCLPFGIFNSTYSVTIKIYLKGVTGSCFFNNIVNSAYPVILKFYSSYLFSSYLSKTKIMSNSIISLDISPTIYSDTPKLMLCPQT